MCVCSVHAAALGDHLPMRQEGENDGREYTKQATLLYASLLFSTLLYASLRFSTLLYTSLHISATLRFSTLL